MNRRGFIGAMAGAAALASVPVAINAGVGSWPSVGQAIEAAFCFRRRGVCGTLPVLYARLDRGSVIEVKPGHWDEPWTWTAIERPMREQERQEVEALAAQYPAGYRVTENIQVRGYVNRPKLREVKSAADCEACASRVEVPIVSEWTLSISQPRAPYAGEYAELMAKHRASGMLYSGMGGFSSIPDSQVRGDGCD